MREIFERDGNIAALRYLSVSENLDLQQAQYNLDQILNTFQENVSVGSTVYYQATPQPNVGVPIYYCEKHKVLTSPNMCRRCEGGFIKRLLNMFNTEGIIEDDYVFAYTRQK